MSPRPCDEAQAGTDEAPSAAMNGAGGVAAAAQAAVSRSVCAQGRHCRPVSSARVMSMRHPDRRHPYGGRQRARA
ncbi:MAG: hypothetical protein IPF94_13570 [Betaproteobacteria bacterium]|nr:hypothetical protein [Betaproteobacteria bacterium]